MLSSFIEIEGRSGPRCREIIRKAKEIGVDAELMLLPGLVSVQTFATSEIAKGIFQLTPDAITDIREKKISNY